MKQRNNLRQLIGGSSFEALLSRYKMLIFRICRHYCGREATAEDLMQDISISLWSKREQLQEIPDGVKREAWVWRMSNNTAIDTLRRRPGHESLDETTMVRMKEEDTAMIDCLREQIECLEEPDKTIVKMQMEGYSYDELALCINMSASNVGTRLMRVKEKLRILMNK